MYDIKSGKVLKSGSDIWSIISAEETVLTKFDHAVFRHIRNDALVYFIDLDIDPEYCDNVQPIGDVDQRTTTATPLNGFQQGAERRLRNFIMDALWKALRLDPPNRVTYLANLDKKMTSVQTEANLLPSKKVTIALLKRMAISA